MTDGNLLPDIYSDMIDLPHHVSMVHPRMPVASRAAQFSPFAALSGYDRIIKDTENEKTASVLAKEHGEAFHEDP